MSAALLLLLAQVSPAPWDQPLAPAFDLEQPVAEGAASPRPSVLQTIGRGFYTSYRATLSRSKGSNCAFEPSCSVYGHQAIERLGLLPGLVLFGARLMRGHVNFDRFYRFDGARLLDPLDDTLDWLFPREDHPRWYWHSSLR